MLQPQSNRRLTDDYIRPPNSVMQADATAGNEWSLPSDTVHTFPRLRVRQLGYVLSTAGTVSIIFNIIAIGAESSNQNVMPKTDPALSGYALWSGILCILAGSLGIHISNQTPGGLIYVLNIYAFSVLCIVSFSLTLGSFVLGIVGANRQASGSLCMDPPFGDIDAMNCRAIRLVFAMDILMLLLAVVEAIAAFLGSVIGCKTLNCCKNYRCSNLDRWYNKFIGTASSRGQTTVPTEPQLVVPAVPPSYSESQSYWPERATSPAATIETTDETVQTRNNSNAGFSSPAVSVDQLLSL